MIAIGDRVYLYHSERMKYLVEVPAAGRFSTHRGHLEFTDILGLEYGDTIATHLGFQLLQSAIHPGARVIETGSGSGALTTILATLVRPDGRVYSYERRPEFSANASDNIRRYGLDDYVEFIVCDPEHEGFAQTGIDTVLLDVPEPWTLLRPAHKALKGGFPVIAIVPNVEQVRRTVSALELEGFTRIRTREMLERSILVRPSGIRPADRMVAHTVYIITAQKINRTPDPECAPTQP
jgi:tRNA (adenine57-N1/adenine58-N1)-methyltransferase